MRAVIDTNVLLSGFLWHGAPHELLEHVRNGKLTLISSPTLLAELADVINRPKFDAILLRSNTSRNHTLDELHWLAEVIEPPPFHNPYAATRMMMRCWQRPSLDWLTSSSLEMMTCSPLKSIKTFLSSPRQKRCKGSMQANQI